MTPDISDTGILNPGRIHYNLSVPQLYEAAIRDGEGDIAADGPLVVNTGTYTGRSPNDKFTVEEGAAKENVWWGKVNKPISEDVFNRLYDRATAYLQGRDLYVRDCYAGHDPAHRLPVRIINQRAWHNLFALNMFVREDNRDALKDFKPAFTVLHVPEMNASPEQDGTNSEAFVLVHFGRKVVLIGGTRYAGEVKKSIFTVLNYLLPEKGVLPMHCSANIGAAGDSALFFGLSGTGKTTLSADPKRKLIGDDEHGWTENGIFNFEGGCYAKVIKLSKEAEPEIYETTRRFGTVLENVVFDPDTRKIDLDDGSRTENTRASYPIEFIPNYEPSGLGGHPKNIVMLTCDAFGVLPPISKLTPAQAMYHFISGYTAKVAGTERGVKEPSATFSTCFGAPFMPRHPTVYARLLGEKIAKHGSTCWLVNTGWAGGPYGVGSRIKIQYTRAMVNAALDGALDNAEFHTHPVFGLAYPIEVPGVPGEVLNPRESWSDKTAYDAKAVHLAGLFNKNFEEFKDLADAEVIAAAPKA